MLDVVKLNNSISYYGTEVSVFDSAIDDYLAAKRAEEGDPDYPI